MQYAGSPCRSVPRMSDPSVETMWRRIRSMRHDPPGLAKRTPRRQVFAAALEQAEQLFVTSAAIEVTARPLTLFYGLSQAGRAIAAAFAEEPWQLKGHGIAARNIQGGFVDLELQDKGGGSFTRLASVLGSPSLPSPVSLHQLWATLPEARDHPLPTEGDLPLLRLWPERMDAMVLSPVSNGWLSGFPTSLAQENNPKEAVARYMSDYPTAAGWEFSVAEEVPLRIYEDPAWRVCVHLRWMTPGMDRQATHREARLREVGVRYGDDDALWVPPALTGNTRPLHPLLVWWAVLYGLSMLARYVPARWTEHLDVDNSALAVPLETVLDGALEACPELIRLALVERP